MTPPLPQSPGNKAAYALPVLVFLLCIARRVGALLNHDVAWLLIAAGRMLSGGTYSRDFFEVNMPLAIAAYIPPRALADAFKWSPELTMLLWVAILVAQCGWLIGRIVEESGLSPIGGNTLPLLLAWVLLCLGFLPGYDFAQREHLIVILGLPFLFLVGSPQARANLKRPLRAYISGLAAIGFFIKPHYAALPFLLVVAAAWQHRSWKELRSVEAVTIATAGVVNAIAVVLLFPDWFNCLRWAADLYGAYRSAHWLKLLAAPGVEAAALCMIFQLVVAAVDRDYRRFAYALLIAEVYSGAAYVVQFTGWGYHSLAARILVYIGLAMALAACLRMNARPMLRGALVTMAVAGMATGAWVAIDTSRQLPTVANLQRFPAAFETASPGDYVYAFSIEMVPVFPTVTLMGLRWGSRFSALWPLVKIAEEQSAREPGEYQRLQSLYGKPLVKAVTEDFERYRPRVVLVDRRHIEGTTSDFDILGQFVADPRFATIWSGYSKIGGMPYPDNHYGFDIYQRMTSPNVGS